MDGCTKLVGACRLVKDEVRPIVAEDRSIHAPVHVALAHELPDLLNLIPNSICCCRRLTRQLVYWPCFSLTLSAAVPCCLTLGTPLTWRMHAAGSTSCSVGDELEQPRGNVLLLRVDANVEV